MLHGRVPLPRVILAVYLLDDRVEGTHIMVFRVSAMMKNCGITAGVIGASALLLGGCAAGKYNSAAQTWQISPQHNGV